MSNRDENTGATPTRPSTSRVSSSVSGGTSGATARQSLLPSPDTSTMIIDDLAYDSGSDDEMSIEAKRVLRRKKLEREKLQKLGKLIPIETENEPEKIKLAESQSEAYALPMRPKEEVSNLTELLNRASVRSSIVTNFTDSELARRQSIISEECRRRKSKAVGFGLVEETQFAKLPQENEEVIQCASEGRAGTSGLNRSPSSRSPPGGRRSTRSSSVLPDETTGSSEEDISLVASFTALRNALQDDKSQ